MSVQHPDREDLFAAIRKAAGHAEAGRMQACWWQLQTAVEVTEALAAQDDRVRADEALAQGGTT